MKTVTIKNKLVTDCYALTLFLQKKGFKNAQVSCSETKPPVTYVYLEDSETKDPTPLVLAWKNPPTLKVTSNKPAGIDGVPEAKADGKDTHVLTIKTLDAITGKPYDGTVNIEVTANQLIKINPTKLSVSGSGTSTIGPSELAGTLTVKVMDLSSVSNFVTLDIRFT